MKNILKVLKTKKWELIIEYVGSEYWAQLDKIDGTEDYLGIAPNLSGALKRLEEQVKKGLDK